MNQRSFEVVACTVLFVCATESTAAAKPCTPPHAVYGLIGDTYNRIGASDGPLGCPTSDEMDHPEGKGRYQFFENGQIGWSPTTGDRSMQIAYRQGNQIIFEWGDTSPFNYDFFEISWTNGPAQAGTNVKGGPRTGGRYAIPVIDLGTYRIGIKGCHNP